MFRFNVLSSAAAGILLAGTASAVVAQNPGPHSTVRIPVGKDRVSSHADTAAKAAPAMAVRVDTVRLQGRVDTVTRTVTQTVTRVDTMMMPIQIPHVGSLYAGLAVGPSFAAPQFTNSDNPGFRIELPFGIDPVHSPLGLRANIGYARYTPQSWLNGSLADAQMMNADLDLKLRLLSVTPANMRIQVYGLAGGSYSRFMNVLESSNGGWSVGNTTFNPAAPGAYDQSWHNGLGWNAGGGASFGKGNKSFFTELRFTYINGVAAPIASIPLVVGVSIY